MPRVIIHHEGFYNEYSTVSDGPCWKRGLTLNELKRITKDEEGERGLRQLEDRLVRAHEKGTSAYMDDDLKDTVNYFLHQENMTLEHFINKFLKR